MATAYGPSIVRDGLVLTLDAANSKSLLTSVEVLVVAGGGAGGGGNYNGGGGGAGGLIYNSAFSVTAGTSYTVTVGAGGTGAATKGANGANSVFGSLTAIGGGGGGAHPGSLADQTGGSGGSGGGGSQGGGPGGAGTAGQGNAGGGLIYAAGAGGGGAGAAVITSGMTGAPYSYGVAPVSGGIGLQYAISGTPTYYAGGGGGGGRSPYSVPQGIGGTGGGGNGAVATGGTGFSGVPNTGGGGGGNYAGEPGTANAGGSGGSGIVIVRYFGPARATGGTITYVDGYTIHRFTTVGSTTFTPNATWSDLSGNGITGTLTNGPTYSSANGGSIVFDGLNDHVDCGTGGKLTLGNNGPFTASAWIRITTLKNFSGIISKVQSDRGGVYSFMCCAHNDGTLAFYNNAAWYYSTNAGITTNTWYNVVFSFNSSVLSYYVNGVAYGTSTLTWPETTAHKVFIGSWYSINTLYDLAGNISNAQLHNRALSAAEILQNFNALRGRYGV